MLQVLATYAFVSTVVMLIMIVLALFARLSHKKVNFMLYTVMILILGYIVIGVVILYSFGNKIDPPPISPILNPYPNNYNF